MDRTQNLSDMKSRILSFIKLRGPSLPIHISKETKTSLLLASAFLSDLASEKTIKISSMKVGGSPLYFLPGQESMLENFEKFLNHKEREALSKLKQAKILKDDELEPAIRVALRSISDFAIPYTIKFQDSSFLFWQHHLTSEDEAKSEISKVLEKFQTQKPVQQVQETPKPELKEEIKPELKEEINPEVKQETEIIQNKIEEEKIRQKEETKEEKKIEPIFHEKKKEKKLLFNEIIKAHLAQKGIELLSIEKSGKKEILARVSKAGKESILLALDKKKVDESDILKAYKRAQALNLPYTLLAKGETSKKLKETIEAHKNLDNIEKLE